MPVLRGWDEELYEPWAKRKARLAAERVAARERLHRMQDTDVSEEDFLEWLAEEGRDERRTEGRSRILKRQRQWIAQRLAELKGMT